MKSDRSRSTRIAALVASLFLAAMGAINAAQAKALTIHRFSGRDGSEPIGPLIEDSAGNLYGTTVAGGALNAGVVFELSPSNNGWTESVLHSFTGADGSHPYGGLAIDANGVLYGTTFSGGPGGGGVAFALSPGGNGAWTFNQLYAFGGPGSSGGSNPNANLVLDSAGNVYGTTQLGGFGSCTNFPGPCGVVFELSPDGDGTWTQTVLWSFGGIPDGSFPYGGVILDSSGTLYGTTSQGGTGKCNDGEGTVIGCGTVFALSPSGETQLYNFKRSEQNGPGSPLVFGHGGALYGNAGYDVFRVKPPKIDGGAWAKTTIYEFTEGAAGTTLSGGVAFDPRGNLYMTTASSGIDGFSTASKLSKEKGGAWTQKTLAKFGKGFTQKQPRGGILVAHDGTLYGTVSGTPGYVFAIPR